ncbi:peptidoglycan-binding protein [Roseibacterium sp. SDUM158016]|uniref:peptidoglycan-binding domain-containing protein n=1 Tax=Roseicyclus sediminis TaxID=2980997 RepID=UPI0021CF4CD5|nr:peptidoglycan-binding domain-containing protein [Roseibacterium sp. SDUM158016]MCU4653986.1 peptidoglycan-binding protein [Roseibacterium sp. SDUM158016]
MKKIAATLAGLAALAACVPAGGERAPPDTRAVAAARGVPPPQAAPDTCYARDATPLAEALGPLPSGADAEGPLWFEYPCRAETDAAFIASVQRALAARGLYGGPATGRLDPPTRAAITAYQRDFGLDSGVLSLAAARALGLVVWETVPEAATEAP